MQEIYSANIRVNQADYCISVLPLQYFDKMRSLIMHIERVVWTSSFRLSINGVETQSIKYGASITDYLRPGNNLVHVIHDHKKSKPCFYVQICSRETSFMLPLKPTDTLQNIDRAICKMFGVSHPLYQILYANNKFLYEKKTLTNLALPCTRMRIDHVYKIYYHSKHNV